MSDAPQTLVPEVVGWRDSAGEQLSIRDWIMIVGKTSDAIGYSELFWPDFVEHDGCIFVRSTPPQSESYDTWRRRLDSKTVVEAVMNHVHVLYLFENECCTPISTEQAYFLAHRLRDMWEAKARIDLPHLDVEVVVYADDVGDPDGFDPQVTLSVRRPDEPQDTESR